MTNALLQSGILAAKANRAAEAVQALTAVLDQDPNSFDALIWLGIMEHQTGEFSSAREHFERAHRLEPKSFAPFTGILRGQSAREEDRPFLESAARILSERGAQDEETRQLTYSLAKAFDDLAEYETAIRYYDQANELAAQLQKPKGLDRRVHSRRLDEMMRVFTRPLIERGHPFACPSEKPIFIVGMIRSGTTLVEQVLSRHAAVRAGGELRFWIDNGPAALLPGAPGLNWELSEFLSLEYMVALNRLAPEPLRVTDKMPLNYALLGLIHLLFPGAPIVHCRRNAADTCLSIYFSPHAAPPDFAYNREDIVFAYREYERVMKHWRSVLPIRRVLGVDYEGFVEDPEKNIRDILAHCGLDWDDACLSPERNLRPVDTPSKWQVRQPIYKTSVGRSRHYASWLGAIGDLV